VDPESDQMLVCPVSAIICRGVLRHLHTAADRRRRRVVVLICRSLYVSDFLPKNFHADLHEIFRDRQWANEQMIKFWWQFGIRIATR